METENIKEQALVLSDLSHEFKQVGKSYKFLEIPVKVVYDNAEIVEYAGILHASNILVDVPVLNRVWIVDKFMFEKGKRIAYVSDKYHTTLDLRRMLKPILYTVDLMVSLIQKKNVWCNPEAVKLVNLTSTIDFSLCDNKISTDFGNCAGIISKNKSLEAVLEPTRKQIFIAALISGLFCFIFGMMIAFVLSIFLGA